MKDRCRQQRKRLDQSKACMLRCFGRPQKASGTKSVEQDTSSRSGNGAYADDADIKPTYDEESMAKENETLKRHYKELSDSIKTTRAKTIEHTTSLIAQNAEFKAQLQEKGFAIAALKNELRKLTGNSVNTKFAKSSILGKPVLQPHRNQSVVRQPTAFKSERPRISKPRFASQVDVNNDLPKPVTTHYLPKGKESACAKPHHMIAPGSSRWKPTGKIFKTVGLRWVPTRNIFTSSITKVDSEPTNGSDEESLTNMNTNKLLMSVQELEKKSPTQLRQETGSIHLAVRITMLIADIEDDFMDPDNELTAYRMIVTIESLTFRCFCFEDVLYWSIARHGRSNTSVLEDPIALSWITLSQGRFFEST
ncbi:hypothetical protein Tco_0155054 [Tanacetum coccineum]